MVKTTQEKKVDSKIKKLDKQEDKIDKKQKDLDKKQKEIKEELTRLEKLKNGTKDSAKKFNKQFKKSISTALIAAFGFLIALAWRDVISEYVEAISSLSPVQGKLISALIVTLIAALGIVLITSLFPEDEK